VVARCLGGRFVFTGRAPLYGVAAGGLPGVRKAIAILREEIELVLATRGCPKFDGLGPDFIHTGAHANAYEETT